METERDPSEVLAVAIEGLSLRINNRILIENFQLHLPAGRRIGITGPSGCGKTTLLRTIVAQQIKPPSKATRFEFRPGRVGYVPQEGGLLPWYSLQRNLSVFAQQNDNHKEWCKDILRWMELDGVAETNTQKLSGGELQRARLACAIASRPSLFCADEPLTEVGLQQRWRLLKAWSGEINERAASLILISHDVETLFYLCDELIVLGGERGKPATEITPFTLPDQNHPRVPGQLDSKLIESFRQMMSRG